MDSAWRGTAGAAASAPCTMRSRCEKRKGAPCTRSHRNLANLFFCNYSIVKILLMIPLRYTTTQQ